jgi:two-component system response regulator RegA
MAVVDLKMPGKSGLELLLEIRRISPETRVVMLTGYGSITNAVEAIKLGAVNYVAKPVDADELLSAFGKQPQVPDEEFQPMSLAFAQWEHIQRVLADCDGNISEAARRLDIPRRTLQRKLKKNAP